jgi:hypothetical protein
MAAAFKKFKKSKFARRHQAITASTSPRSLEERWQYRARVLHSRAENLAPPVCLRCIIRGRGGEYRANG